MNKEKLQKMLEFYKKARQMEEDNQEELRLRPLSMIDLLEALLEE